MPSSLRVLVIEDSEDDFKLLVGELNRGGYELSAKRVQTAAEFTVELENSSWDIVLSDWSTPGFSATHALEILKRHTLDLPFIIVAGSSNEEAAVDALRRGAHDFLSKDKLTRLLPAVDRELREAKIRRESRVMQDQLMISDRMASIGILAAGVAHEINNPLASALANLDVSLQTVHAMQQDRRDSRQLTELFEELSDVREAALRIHNIVRDLKLFSRPDENVKSVVDVSSVLESSLRMTRHQIQHRAQLVRDYTPVAPVEANESRLGQVFVNLLVNAAQSIVEGHAASNEIRVATRPAASGWVSIEISDSGAGMAPDVLKRVFTPFFTTKPVGVGTGLGLVICHRIITSLRGEICIESVLGKGTKFIVELPPAPSAVVALPRLSAIAPRRWRRGRVLVIDDDVLVLRGVQRALGCDHEVATLRWAAEAIQKLTAGERFDVIVCDLMMPEMTGVELHARLLLVAPEQAARMIFLTGGALSPSVHSFLDELPNLLIEKPFDPIALRATINERVASVGKRGSSAKLPRLAQGPKPRGHV
jgi:signal transduction histidine kinase